MKALALLALALPLMAARSDPLAEDRKSVV